MQVWSVVIAVLVAVLAGALLPLIFQLRATLRSVQVALDSASPKLNRSLDELGVVTHEAQIIVTALKDGIPQGRAFVDAAAGLTETMTQLQASVRTATAVGAAVGPAVAAAFQAFRAIRAQDAPDFRSMPDGTDESPAGLPPREASDERQ